MPWRSCVLVQVSDLESWLLINSQHPQHLLHLSALVRGARGIGVTPFFSVVDACRREENYETCSRPNLFVLPEWESGLLGCWAAGTENHTPLHWPLLLDRRPRCPVLLVHSADQNAASGLLCHSLPYLWLQLLRSLGQGIAFLSSSMELEDSFLISGKPSTFGASKMHTCRVPRASTIDPRVETYWQEVPRCPNLPVHHGIMSLDSLFWQGQAAQPVLARFLAYDNQRSPFVDFVEHTEASPTMKCALLVWLRPKPYWYLNPKQL
jgi:hypothetical protein